MRTRGKLVTAAILPPTQTEGRSMTLAELCLVLGALFAFATLVVKVIEVSRK